jgi:uracil DNA glycosylase
MRNKQYWVNELGFGWALALKETLKSDYIEKLFNYLTVQKAFNTVSPSEKDIFRYFKLTPRENLKAVVIIKEYGIDINMYPVKDACNYINSSYDVGLEKISECIYREYYLDNPSKVLYTKLFDFDDWAKQGILILPLALTISSKGSGEHIKPWRKFVEAVLQDIVKYSPGTIFLLLDEQAKQYSEFLSQNQHVFSCDSPAIAAKESKDWHCKMFKQIDLLTDNIYGPGYRFAW